MNVLSMYLDIMNFQEILTFVVENPWQGAGSAALLGFGLVGLRKALPSLIGTLLAFMISSTFGLMWSTLTETKKKLIRSAAYPRTAVECANYKPVKGHRFQWDLEGKTVTKVVDFVKKNKEDGRMYVHYTMPSKVKGQDDQHGATEIGNFRRQIVKAEAIVV